jgi:succinyl-CoA synthetase beta subunit
MIAEALDISKETYFAILMDRGAGGAVMVASEEGGMDIEAVAERSPEKIHKVIYQIPLPLLCVNCIPFQLPIDISKGLDFSDLLGLAIKIGFEGAKAREV